MVYLSDPLLSEYGKKLDEFKDLKFLGIELAQEIVIKIALLCEGRKFRKPLNLANLAYPILSIILCAL